ncbi:MAG: hypothetical protein LM576_04970 [Thermofilum sp.]|jgi:hypothetical protein|nr:hypothetical protein [Thermofilum sp.]
MVAAYHVSRRALSLCEGDLEEFARFLARCFRGEQRGKLRRLFSALTTCTNSEEARAIVAFYYQRVDNERAREALRQLFESLRVDDEKFRRCITPKLRPLFNFTMYYMLVQER